MPIRPLLLILLLLAACRRTEEPTRDPAHDTFVATYIDLRRAVLETGGGPEYEARKAAILREHGTTEAELTAFVDRQKRAGTLSAIFEQIEDSLSVP